MSDNFIRIARTAEIPPGTVKVFEIEDISIAICNVNGSFHAVENVCSHDDGPLGEGILLGKEIECPRHGAHFDVTTGEVKRQPAFGPIQTFPVRVENDTIHIDISNY